MKKASFLILFITVFIINNTYSQNAIIESNHIIAKRNDTINVNMNENNYEPDGEKLKIKRIVQSDDCIQFGKILNDSVFQFMVNKLYCEELSVILLIQEIRGNIVLASYRDTLNITIINDNTSIIEANNIRSVIKPTGYLFNGGSNYQLKPIFNAPKNNTFNAIYNAILFMGGYTENNKINTVYNLGYGTNYLNWGINTSDTCMSRLQKMFNMTYKLTSDKIAYHQQNWAKTNYIIDSTILIWPAHGDTLFNEPYNLYPFEDLNQNNKYEPLLGEYPIIKGDEFILFFNKTVNKDPNKKSFEIDILTTVYTFRKNLENEVLNNTIFVNYKLINRSKNNYTKFKVGFNLWHYFGFPFNDYIGCDTNLNLHFVYNATNDFYYKNNHASLGVCILNKKLDGFVYNSSEYNPPYCEICDSGHTNEIVYNYLYGKRALGSFQYYGGDGISGHPNVSNQIVKHAFFGDVNDLSQWSERSANLPAGGKYAYLSIPEVDIFKPNDTIDIEMAYIFAQDKTLNNFTIVNKLKKDVQDLINFYNVIGKEEITKIENKIKIYPNPSNDKFYIDFGNNDECFDVKIYDLNGKLILSKKSLLNYSSIDVNNLKQGIYFVNFSNNKNTYTTKFIKN